ncbi:F-actin-capping protein subunit beta [Malassezia sp. CBS 17886]|nr:F-actin-capping protein subunit beta [Malassezia sp. CBS 17886]
MAQDDAVTLALDLLRRLPPKAVKENLETLSRTLPDQADELSSAVDQPLEVRIDSTRQGAGREYLCCDYNRDGASFRSWMSNEYDPPLADDGADAPPCPTGKLRDLELQANDAFDTYRRLVYLWDLDDVSDAMPANFAGVVVFKKDLGSPEPHSVGTFGSWDSLHVFEVSTLPASGAPSARYKVSSTVMLTLAHYDVRTTNRTEGDAKSTGAPPNALAPGDVDLGGSLTRQTEETLALGDSGHVANLGRLVEDVENRIRNQLQEVYFGKMHDIVGTLRSREDLAASRRAKELQAELVAGWER